MNQEAQNTNEILEPEKIEEDVAEKSLRPSSLSEFIGQEQSLNNLKVFIDAAKQRKDPLDHVLLYGPPGLGKTTIAQVISKEMGVGFKGTSGPILAKSGDLAAILTNLGEADILFIDEIHRLNPAVEEVLYSAMEDFTLDLIIGEGPAARTVRIDLPRFTLVGATTRLGLISNPLRDRFGIPLRMEFYTEAELRQVIERGAKILNVSITKNGANEIAKRARGTPRIALRLLKRVRDFALVQHTNTIDDKIADVALLNLEVDKDGLDSADRRYLRFIAENFQGGPVGVETIAAGLSEHKDSLEEAIEPYLLQKGFISRTPRGRIISKKAFDHIGIKPPKNQNIQTDLFDDVQDES